MIGTQELSRVINNNGGNLLDAIKIDDIRSYINLKTRLHTENVAESTDYQEAFRSYYSIGGVGVNKEFIQRYFEVLEAHKNDEVFNFRQVAKELLGARPKRKLSSAQFAYLAKMANVIDGSQNPIYDNHIAELFEFDKPTQSKLDSRERMNIYLAFYADVQRMYADIMAENMIRDTLVVFKILLKKYTNDDFPKYDISEMKKIDFLVDAIGKMKGKLVKA
ncbi:MAG: hypothetical protein MRZ79_25905 [Bacteroidia bacterium]|nr:hypothetical protein [Bacteroidia bacterium]